MSEFSPGEPEYRPTMSDGWDNITYGSNGRQQGGSDLFLSMFLCLHTVNDLRTYERATWDAADGT